MPHGSVNIRRAALPKDVVEVAPEVPVQSTVVTSEPPIEAPYVGYTGFNVERAQLDVSFRPVVVVAAQRQFQIAPFTFVARPLSADVVAPPPDVPVRPLIVAEVQPPPTTGTILAFRSSVEADRPTEPTVRTAPPPPQQQPFIQIAHSNVDPAPPPPDTPPKPVVVAAQPTPPMAGWIRSYTPRAEPTAAAPDVTPPRPVVVTITSVPANGSVVIVRPVATDQPPRRPVVVAAVKPPEVASTVVVSRTFFQDPVLRRPYPTVVFDVAKPPPYGSARIGHGFAAALPPPVTYGTGNAGNTSASTGAAGATGAATGGAGHGNAATGNAGLGTIASGMAGSASAGTGRPGQG